MSGTVSVAAVGDDGSIVAAGATSDTKLSSASAVEIWIQVLIDNKQYHYYHDD